MLLVSLYLQGSTDPRFANPEVRKSEVARMLDGKFMLFLYRLPEVRLRLDCYCSLVHLQKKHEGIFRAPWIVGTMVYHMRIAGNNNIGALPIGALALTCAAVSTCLSTSYANNRHARTPQVERAFNGWKSGFYGTANRRAGPFISSSWGVQTIAYSSIAQHLSSQQWKHLLEDVSIMMKSGYAPRKLPCLKTVSPDAVGKNDVLQ